MKYSAVTIYRKNDDGWDRQVYYDAAVCAALCEDRIGGGDTKSSTARVRIFSNMPPEILPGDRLMIGVSVDAVPNPERALTVYEICDNTCISNPHTRISAR